MIYIDDTENTPFWKLILVTNMKFPVKCICDGQLKNLQFRDQMSVMKEDGQLS